jgi:hypothetical protein
VRTSVLGREIAYTGAQLRSGWIEETAGVTGDAAVAFLGPCEVAPEHMVDLEDLEVGARISSPRMLHVIVEHPRLDLGHTTTRQRLLMAIAGELLNGRLGEPLVRRDGDDLYLRDRKLSVSVATASPTAGLIHAGLNLRGEGAPVPAVGLEELGVEPREFADRLLAAYAAEIMGGQEAARRVRPVR